MQAIYDQRLRNCAFLSSLNENVQDKSVVSVGRDQIANDFSGYTVEAAIQAFMAYTEDKPEKWNKEAGSVFGDAFEEFPCELEQKNQ